MHFAILTNGIWISKGPTTEVGIAWVPWLKAEIGKLLRLFFFFAVGAAVGLYAGWVLTMRLKGQHAKFRKLEPMKKMWG